jgi:hypothetical protein
MRRWFLIFLVVLFPMQLSWAAAGRYCHLESGTTAQHAENHEHQHQDDVELTDGASHDVTGTTDADSGHCHTGGCTAMLLQSMALLTVSLSSNAHSTPAQSLSSHPASPPERPNWADLA